MAEETFSVYGLNNDEGGITMVTVIGFGQLAGGVTKQERRTNYYGPEKPEQVPAGYYGWIVHNPDEGVLVVQVASDCPKNSGFRIQIGDNPVEVLPDTQGCQLKIIKMQ